MMIKATCQLGTKTVAISKEVKRTMPRTKGYQVIENNFDMTDDGDKWANVRSWHYAIAEVMYHNEMDIPASWGFEDSPMHNDVEWTFSPQEYNVEVLRELLEEDEVDETDLRDFGERLHHLTQRMIKAGEDY
jgi:hypothetical protein